jgi:hypothetical protein
LTEKRKKDKMNTEQAIPEARTESIKKSDGMPVSVLRKLRKGESDA